MRDEFFEPTATQLSDDNNVICPYCKHEYQPDTESYSEDTREEECSECGKKFHVWQAFSVDHHSKPDCDLNGEQHQWDTVSARVSEYESCSLCDKWRKKAAPIPVSAETNGS